MLRVVSTDAPAWWGSAPDSQSFLTTLRPQTGGLVEVGQVGGLGKGDRVYAVRMIDDTGYVVTFRQVDPLYTLDLGDAAHPQVLGKLDLPGYSSYLHPISDNLLLGIGQNVDIKRTSQRHADLALRRLRPEAPDSPRPRDTWPGLVARPSPTTTRSSTGPRPGSSSCRSASRQSRCTCRARPGSTSSAGSSTARRGSPQLPQIDRSLVVRKSLFTVSSAGVASNGLTSLASLGWDAFPVPPTPKPVPGGPIISP